MPPSGNGASDHTTETGDRVASAVTSSSAPVPGDDRSGPAATSGRVRVAVVDSGIHPGHPHIGGVSGGIAFVSPDGPTGDYLDRLGHGTAVAAAIREKAPEADLYAVKIFDGTLGTSIDRLVAAVGWAIESGMHIINLSLGTARHEHREALTALVDRAAVRGAVIVAAAEDDGVEWLPGSLPGVVAVRLDWECPRGRVSGRNPRRPPGVHRLRLPATDPRGGADAQPERRQLRGGEHVGVPGPGGPAGPAVDAGAGARGAWGRGGRR